MREYSKKSLKNTCTRFLKLCTHVTRVEFDKALQIALNLAQACERRCRSL